MKQLLMACFCALLVACASPAVRTTTVVDDRPGISFELSALRGTTSQYELFINGISYGNPYQYRAGRVVLRTLPGRQEIEIRRNQQVIFATTVILSENTERVLKVIYDPQ